MELGQQVLTALRWTMGARFMGQITSWSIGIIVARLLRPADYGLMATATMFIAFFTLLSELGLGLALIQKQEMDKRTIRQVFGLVLVVNCSLFVLSFALSPVVARFFGEPRLVALLRVLSLQFIIMSFGVVPQALLQRQLEFKKKSLLDFSVIVLGSAFCLGLALSGQGVWALVGGSLAINVARSVGLNVIAPRFYFPSFDWRGIQRVIRFGGLVSVARLIWYFYSQSDIFVAAKFLGRESLGFYSMAMDVASLPSSKLNSLINEIALPAFARIQTESQLVARHFLKAVRVMSFFAFPVFFGISSVAPELVAVLLGDAWEKTIVPLQVLSLVMPLLMLSSLLHTTLMGLGHPGISVIVLLIASITMPVGFFLGSSFGLIGLCFVWIFGYPLIFLVLLSFSLPVIGIRGADFFYATARPAVAGAGIYAAVAGMRMFPVDANSLAQLMILVTVGATVYGAMMMSIYREGFQEVFGLVKR